MPYTKEGEPLDESSLVESALKSSGKVAEMDAEGRVLGIVETDVERLMDFEEDDKPAIKPKQGGTRTRAANKGMWFFSYPKFLFLT